MIYNPQGNLRRAIMVKESKQDKIASKQASVPPRLPECVGILLAALLLLFLFPLQPASHDCSTSAQELPSSLDCRFTCHTFLAHTLRRSELYETRPGALPRVGEGKKIGEIRLRRDVLLLLLPGRRVLGGRLSCSLLGRGS